MFVVVVILMKPACGSDVFSSVDDDDESDESTAESIGVVVDLIGNDFFFT